MIRAQWVHNIGKKATELVSAEGGVSVPDLVAQFVDVTDTFGPMVAALEVWTFQLKASGHPTARVIMSDQLHRNFTKVAEADYNLYLSPGLTDDARNLMTKLLEDQPDVVAALSKAATIDPDALKGAKGLPSGKTTSLMN
jgi:hypothetical protein